MRGDENSNSQTSYVSDTRQKLLEDVIFINERSSSQLVALPALSW